MVNNNFQWADFYTNVAGREPRELLIKVLDYFKQNPSENLRHAIDLGCGDGTETGFLLANGWNVLAIDGEQAAFKHLNAKIPPEAQARLQTQVAKFEAVELSPADLIYAGYSVPFCHPQHFAELWDKIVSNINPGGRFAGQLFGVNDTWASNPDMTFFTAEQARALFTAFELEHFHEEDEDGQSTIGPKHWHVFHVIARKK
jgi:tellurite methyltransferase